MPENNSALSIILVQPQMGENIGAAARILSNFGLRDLRIVAPRDGWPNPKAEETARNAKFIIDEAKVFPTFQEAMADLHYLFAVTARPRDMVKPYLTPKETAAECYKHIQNQSRCGLVFGPERSGLTNGEVALCDAVVTIPVDPEHASLNLAQAVAILCYECYCANTTNTPPLQKPLSTATREEINGLFSHLETTLDQANFFKAPEKRERMLINIQNMFLRAELTDQDVRTLRGILTSLSKHGT